MIVATDSQSFFIRGRRFDITGSRKGEHPTCNPRLDKGLVDCYL
jgi:hypothetical protein